MKHLAVLSATFIALTVAVPVVFIAILLLTNGYGNGWPAALVTIVVVALGWWWRTRAPGVDRRAVGRREVGRREVGRRGDGRGVGRRAIGRRGRVVLAIPVVLSLITIWLCIPLASSQRQLPPASDVAPTRYWELPTGSRLAYWHVPSRPGAPARPFPIVVVHGGPGGYQTESNKRVLARLSEDGYDVWLYDQAGGGASDLLPDDEYSHQRNVADFAAVLDEIGSPTVGVISQSYGAMIVASALADGALRGRIAKAAFLEPGPYDFTVADRFDVAEVYGGAEPNGGERANSEEGWWNTTMVQPRLLLGLLLPPGNRFVGQNEASNAFAGADLRIQTRGSSCLSNYERINPSRFAVGLNLKANYLISGRGVNEARSIKAALADSDVPIMVALGECSYVGRQYQTALITDYPVVERVQYLTGVGHALSDGLDDHDDRTVRMLEEFFDGAPPSIPNFPTKAEVPRFLLQRR